MVSASTDGRSRRTIHIHLLEQAYQDFQRDGDLVAGIATLHRAGIAINILEPHHLLGFLGIDTAVIVSTHGQPRALRDRELARWTARMATARRIYNQWLEFEPSERIRVPRTALRARPRGRRARHVARSTSSNDPGDDDPGEPPPPPPDDPQEGRP
jgi:hypothetical protein